MGDNHNFKNKQKVKKGKRWTTMEVYKILKVMRMISIHGRINGVIVKSGLNKELWLYICVCAGVYRSITSVQNKWRSICSTKGKSTNPEFHSLCVPVNNQVQALRAEETQSKTTNALLSYIDDTEFKRKKKDSLKEKELEMKEKYMGGMISTLTSLSNAFLNMSSNENNDNINNNNNSNDNGNNDSGNDDLDNKPSFEVHDWWERHRELIVNEDSRSTIDQVIYTKDTPLSMHFERWVKQPGLTADDILNKMLLVAKNIRQY